MGAWVVASVLFLGAVSSGFGVPLVVQEGLDLTSGVSYLTKPVSLDPVHSAVAPPVSDDVASSSNYQPFNYNSYTIATGKNPTGANSKAYGTAVEPPDYAPHSYQLDEDYASVESQEDRGIIGGRGEREDIEEDGRVDPNKFIGDLNGYTQYKASNTYNFAGPHQLETINTKSYHKEVSPFESSDFSNHEDHHEDHHEDEQHAEVHYHQHKHVHKHNHKQEHHHKHKQEHKHSHGHKHEHKASHDHKHKNEHHHDHKHHSEHKHVGEHKHSHHASHKHEHYNDHKHDHKHVGEHKHDHHSHHDHKHHADHKHSHHNSHKHDHKHGHKHHSDHKHDHKHHASHKHHAHHDHKHKDHHEHKHSEHHAHKHKKHH